MQVGETLEVLADDPAAESDIHNLVKHLEQEIVSSTKEKDTTRIVIKKVKWNKEEARALVSEDKHCLNVSIA